MYRKRDKDRNSLVDGQHPSTASTNSLHKLTRPIRNPADLLGPEASREPGCCTACILSLNPAESKTASPRQIAITPAVLPGTAPACPDMGAWLAVPDASKWPPQTPDPRAVRPSSLTPHCSPTVGRACAVGRPEPGKPSRYIPQMNPVMYTTTP